MNIFARFKEWNKRRKLLVAYDRWICGYNFAFDMYCRYGATAPTQWESYMWSDDRDEFDAGVHEAERDYASGKLLKIISDIDTRRLT